MKLTSKTFVLLSISLAVFLAEVFLIQKVAFAQLNVQKQLRLRNKSGLALWTHKFGRIKTVNAQFAAWI